MSDYGTLEIVDGRYVLSFERRYSQPLERVWRAITDPDEMMMWFPSKVEGERAVGEELVFSYDVLDEDSGERAPEGFPVFRGEVLRFEPPRIFQFTWGPEVIRMELVPDGEGTRLLFSQILAHRATAGRNGSGWHACLDALEAHLGEEIEPADGFDLYDEYVVRIGIPLGTPNGDGSVTWELATHVGPGRVEEAVEASTEWVGTEVEAPLRLDFDAGDESTVYRVTHQAIGADPELASTWHARLIQLDLYLAAGVYHPVPPHAWVSQYAELLGG